MPITDFKEHAVRWLIGDIQQPKCIQPVANFHYLFPIPATGKKNNPTRKCMVCATAGKRRESRYICAYCEDQPSLCIYPCFVQYHSNLGITRNICYDQQIRQITLRCGKVQSGWKLLHISIRGWKIFKILVIGRGRLYGISNFTFNHKFFISRTLAMKTNNVQVRYTFRKMDGSSLEVVIVQRPNRKSQKTVQFSMHNVFLLKMHHKTLKNDFTYHATLKILGNSKYQPFFQKNWRKHQNLITHEPLVVKR